MTREEELLQSAPMPGTRILVRFPRPHPPQKQDEAWYPGIVVRAYPNPTHGDGRSYVLLSAAVFVDYYADPPKPPGGVYAQTMGVWLTCMDLQRFEPSCPDKGGYRLL